VRAFQLSTTDSLFLTDNLDFRTATSAAHSVSGTITDSLANDHTITLTFTKIASDNIWEWEARKVGSVISSADPLGSGLATFDTSGRSQGDPKSPEEELTLGFTNGAQDMTVFVEYDQVTSRAEATTLSAGQTAPATLTPLPAQTALSIPVSGNLDSRLPVGSIVDVDVLFADSLGVLHPLDLRFTRDADGWVWVTTTTDPSITTGNPLVSGSVEFDGAGLPILTSSQPEGLLTISFSNGAVDMTGQAAGQIDFDGLTGQASATTAGDVASTPVGA